MFPPPQCDTVLHNLGSALCSQQTDDGQRILQHSVLFQSGELHFYSMNSTSLAPARQLWLLDAPQCRALCVTPLKPVLPHWAPSAWSALLSKVCAGINLSHWCCGYQGDGQASPGITLWSAKALHIPGAISASQFSHSFLWGQLWEEAPQWNRDVVQLLCQNASCHSPPAFLTTQYSFADTTQPPTSSINMGYYSQTYHINDFLHCCEHELIS